MEQETRALLAAGHNTKLSVAAFAKRFKISRSSLYETHRNELSNIERSFALLREEIQAVEASKRKPSISSLQSELTRTRQRAKADLASMASLQMRDLLTRCGPAIRKGQNIIIERQEMERRIEQLEGIVHNQRNLIRQLLGQISNPVGSISESSNRLTSSSYEQTWQIWPPAYTSRKD